jgi:hypothetical protein
MQAAQAATKAQAKTAFLPARSWSSRWSSESVRDPDAPVEADKIGAAAEEHMLAVVDDLATPGCR